MLQSSQDLEPPVKPERFSGSKWNNSSSVFVGFFGAGELNVEAGGFVSNTISNIGSTAFGSVGVGQATVSGMGSQWSSTGELRIGALGTLTVLAGGLVTVGGTGSLNEGTITNNLGVIHFDNDVANQGGADIGGTGDFTAVGGWTNEGLMDFTGTAEIHGDVANQAGGRIESSGGGVTTFHDSVIHNGAEIRTAGASQTVFFGSVTGDGIYTGSDTIFFDGTVQPGNGAGLMSTEGNVIFGSASKTIIELGGLIRGDDHDAVDVDLGLTLAGELAVIYFDAFEASAGDSFDLFYAQSITGAFDTVDFSGLGPSLFWNLEIIADFSSTTDVLRLSAVNAVPLPPATEYLLRVATSGSGSVSSSPAGINCGADCSETYSAGTLVSLTPTAANNFQFTGWIGNCSGTGACNLTMNATRNVTATFAPDADGDGVLDVGDICPNDADSLQTDSDIDGVGDACDLCPDVPDADQQDSDGDGVGDACGSDDDNDGMSDSFELTHGLDPKDAADADLDPDRDGLSNLEEFQQDRNPRVNEPAVIMIINTVL